MNIAQIESNLQKLVESVNVETFIYDVLLAYGTPKPTIKRLQSGGKNLSKAENEIIWKKKMFFCTASNQNLNTVFENLKIDPRTTKYNLRFIIVTDFETLLAFDTKTLDSLETPILDIAKYFDFFLPLAGMEKAQQHTENMADVKASERMAKLFEEIKKDNATETTEQAHNLNVFLSRLLFCFFAEDTGIFEKNQFTNAIKELTQIDGSDLHTLLDALFLMMDTKPEDRTEQAHYLQKFPYVNGGLFKTQHSAPRFNTRSCKLIIESGDLDWSAINPDIFGSMFQAVIDPEKRGNLGMHYTSVPNIMKVIEPLFLTELKEEFERVKENNTKLTALLQRIQNIKIFDPACGSGNFLIIAYKELRKLEMDIFIKQKTLVFSDIKLINFYGIEIDDFAHEIAMLSLWLAEHQMNKLFFDILGVKKPPLPLMQTGNIVHGNACRLNWEEVCPKNDCDEIYILGNPPFNGSSKQSLEQKIDMAFVFKGIANYKNLDYVAAWFLLGAKFIQNLNAQFALVSTNSICQGEQVAILWKHVFNENLEIGFAHTSFKWKNSAKDNAAVSVTIIGIRNINLQIKKILFEEGKKIFVNNIDNYLSTGISITVDKRSENLSNLPKMASGIKAGDGGNLIFSLQEKNKLLNTHPQITPLIKDYVGADEFINGNKRFCLWVSHQDIELAYSIPELNQRFEQCRSLRLKSKKVATQKKANFPHEFDETNYNSSNSLFIPQTGSEKRDYLPVGFINNNTVISNAARAIYNPERYLFSILSSRMHIVWVKTVAGRQKIDPQYSNTLCYNTFPFPDISAAQKKELEVHVKKIIEEREKHSEKTLAQRYDPDKMPEGLRAAHHQNDLAIERCYRSKPFESDSERLEYLFKLYEQMIAQEKQRGTLFESAAKKKKKS